jgi:hypothetical protein
MGFTGDSMGYLLVIFWGDTVDGCEILQLIVDKWFSPSHHRIG